jgi:hypothetical protein
MIISLLDNKAKQFAKDSNVFRLVKKKKFVTQLIIRYDHQDNLRVFLREEVGKVQHVVWLSEEELSTWANSPVESHFHLTTPRGAKCRSK